MNDSLLGISQQSDDPRAALDDLAHRLAGDDARQAPDPTPDPVQERLVAAAERLGRSHWDLTQARAIDATAVIESRRPRLGPALVRGQRVIRRLTGWYLLPILQRIQQFQDRATATIEALAEAQAARQAYLEARIDQTTAGLEASLAAVRAEAGAVRDVQADLLHHQRLLGRLDRLERLVQVLRLGGADLPFEPALGTRSVIAGDPDRFDYLAFEDRFRGSPEQVREWQAPLVEHFREAAGPILDVGCGRGEFLGLLRAAGLESYGIDESPALVAACRQTGLEAFRDGAIPHLESLPAAHLGGLYASHVVEHLPRDDLWTFLRLAGEKIRPGGVCIIESPNPRTLAVTATTFWLDPTHVRPVHPETASFLLEQAGFDRVAVTYRAPFPDADRLPRAGQAPAEADTRLVRALDDLIDRLNEVLYGPRDYIAIARRRLPGESAT